jgi:xylulokinase
LRSSGRAPADCAGIGVAAQLDGIVAVDATNRPLGPAPIWMDRRATAELEAATARIGPDRIRSITGANADPSHGAPKIAWLRDHLEATPDGYLLPASWVVARLTGVRAVDPANASCLLLLDLERGAWAPELLDAFGIPAPALGDLRPATDVVGPLLGDLARAWGLPPCPVVVVPPGPVGPSAGVATVEAGA